MGGRVSSAKTPGDTAESLAARRRFLHAGWYQPIAHALRDAIGDGNDPILDVGCGEGYYLAQLRRSNSYALDISKRAVQMASKLLPNTQCVVGTAYRLPVQDESLATVYTVFAPHSISEYVRVLQPGGRWITVTPGPNHLREMRPQRENRMIERDDRRAEPPMEADYAERIQFTLHLSDEAAHDLFTMTPLQFQSAAHTAVATVRNVTVDVWVSHGTKRV